MIVFVVSQVDLASKMLCLQTAVALHPPSPFSLSTSADVIALGRLEEDQRVVLGLGGHVTFH